MRILLTGASGFVGRRVASALAKRHQVTGTYLTQPAAIPGCALRQVDAADEPGLLRCFHETSPDLVIHAAAMASPERCQERPQEARRANVEGAAAAARACRTAGVRLVYVSTDLVFDGKKPPYRESDIPNPVNLYARTKREAELAVRELLPDALILRLALCYGFNPVGQPTFTDTVHQSLSKKKRVRLFSDQFRTPIFLGDAAEAILRLADLKPRGKLPSGVFHMGGPEKVSRQRFGEILCEVWGFDKKLIEPIRMADEPSNAARPPDCSLDGSKLNALLGFTPRDVKEGLRQLRRER